MSDRPVASNGEIEVIASEEPTLKDMLLARLAEQNFAETSRHATMDLELGQSQRVTTALQMAVEIPVVYDPALDTEVDIFKNLINQFQTERFNNLNKTFMPWVLREEGEEITKEVAIECYTFLLYTVLLEFERFISTLSNDNIDLVGVIWEEDSAEMVRKAGIEPSPQNRSSTVLEKAKGGLSQQINFLRTNPDEITPTMFANSLKGIKNPLLLIKYIQDRARVLLLSPREYLMI